MQIHKKNITGSLFFLELTNFVIFSKKEIEIFWGELFVFPTEIQLPSFAILLEKISKLFITQNFQKKKKKKKKP
jgi:hypothetical protein